MEDFEENETLNDFRQEENGEETEYFSFAEKQYASRSYVSIRWTKPASVFELKFVSKNVLLLHVENTLLFYDVSTLEDKLLVMGAANVSSSSFDKLPSLSDGIDCVDCCGTDLLAFSEHPPSARVIVCRYPDMKVLATLVDNDNSVAYKSIMFLKLEYLIGLRDYPAFDLIVWAWRIEEILFVVDTGFRQPNQSLRLQSDTSGRDVYLSQTEQDVKCRLQLWTVSVSYKTVFAKSTPVALPDGAVIVSGCWSSSSDWFVYCDSSMDVYRTRPGAPNPEMCVKYTGNDVGPTRSSRALVCRSEKGFVLYTVDKLTCFRHDGDGVFTRVWSISMDCTLYSMITEENCVYAWSDQGVLLKLTPNEQQQLKLYGTDIKYFTFVKPTDEAIATIDKSNILRIWNAFTGELKSEIKLNGIATNVCSNPVYYYVAIPFENGKVELWKTDPRENDLEEISKMVLCDDVLSLIKFFNNGEACIVTSLTTGRFYYVNIKLGQSCYVVRDFHWKKRIIDVDILKNTKLSSVIVAVYANNQGTEMAGNNIVIFDTKFNVLIQLKDMRFYYSTVFRPTYFTMETPNIISMVFTTIKTRSVHVISINIETNVLNLKVIRLMHNLNNIKVYLWKNHCITCSDDGTYSVNWYCADDDLWMNIIKVYCNQWQTGGLIAAEIDSNVYNILTLSRRGNFMCMSLNSDFSSCFKRKYRINEPTFIDNMKMEGIGSEGGPKGEKRVTWDTLGNDIVMDPIVIANMKRKDRVDEEFRQIKKELVSLLDANVNGPEDQKINIEEFELNTDYRENFRKKCEIERQQYRAKIQNDMTEFMAQKKLILNEHWESMFVKPKSIYCLKTFFIVNNYSVSKVEQEFYKNTNRLVEKSWLPIKDEETYRSMSMSNTSPKDYTEILDNKSYMSHIKSTSLNNNRYNGSISYKFIDVFDYLNSSRNGYTFEMVKYEIVLLRFTIIKLKYTFNQLFDKLFAKKKTQLDNLNRYNKRLSVIENELRLACKIEPAAYATVVYEWNQYEQIEQLLRVKDDEVPVKPYRDGSADGSRPLSGETDSEEFRFRRRALLDMMDGVLEKSWEDELRTDVPKPQCMLNEKLLADYTDADYKAVAEYGKAVAAKDNDRAKYKRMLEDEQTRIREQIVNTVDVLDDRVFKLFQTKSKYDMAVNQERMKILRLSNILDDNDRRKRQVRLHEQANSEIEKTIEEITQRIATIVEIRRSLFDTIDTSTNTIVNLNERFKSEFPTQSSYRQALIVYNRRPTLRSGNYRTLSLSDYQLVAAITDPSNDNVDRLCEKSAKYLRALRTFDDYNKYLDDNELDIVHDEQAWRKICHYRRLKIQSEFRIVTCQNEATDKAKLLDDLARDVKTTGERLKTSTAKKLENREFYYDPDSEIQLVIKQGYAEVELTGHVEDFYDTVIITHDSIKDVNARIKEVGKLKVDALFNLLVSEYKYDLVKKEHDLLEKYEIPLYKHRHKYISTMNMTQNMLNYLTCYAMGVDIVQEAQQKLSKELLAITSMYENKKLKLRQCLDQHTEAMKKLERENKKIEAKINRAILSWSELHNKIDHSLTGKLKSIRDNRLKNIMQRAEIVFRVQNLKKEIEILQTGLKQTTNTQTCDS